MRVQDWYDLPELYDQLFDGDSADEVDLLLRIAREHDVDVSKVLEPACGSGRLVREVARRGIAVTGFDRNVTALRHGRRQLRSKGLRAKLLEGDFVSFELRSRFDLAHCPLSSIKYLLSECDLREHLRRMAACVRPGGLYLIGLHLADEVASTESWGVDGVEFELSVDAPDLRRRRERVRCVLRTGAQSYEDAWWWRTYEPEQLERTIRAVDGWELAASYDFDGNRRPLDDERLDKLVALRRQGNRIK